MIQATANYVQHTPDGQWRLIGSRVTLDSVAHLYRDGYSPEMIQDEFPRLSLEAIHGAIAFYLRNRQEIDLHLAAQSSRWQTLQRESEHANRPILDRLRAARARLGSP